MKKSAYGRHLTACITVLFFLFSAYQVIFAQTWIRKLDGYSLWSICKDYSGNIYAGTTGTARGIFKSTDGGESWTNVYSTGTSNYLNLDCDSLNNLYAANVSNGMVISTDGGQSFSVVPSSTFGGNSVNAVACGKNGHIFAGATNGGIWRSTDYGATFTNTALQTYSIVEIAVDRFNPDIIYAGASSTSLNGFFISTDGGVTFGSSTNNQNIWEIIQTSGNALFIVTTASPYPVDKSTDGGLTWTTMSTLSSAKRGAALDLIENIYVAGNGGVYKSTDGGSTFINHNFTTSSNKIISFGYKMLVCAIGTTAGGVWIYADSLLIPVELTKFTAAFYNGAVNLSWSTDTEINNSGFEIERSINGSPFQRMAFTEGNGTTSQAHSYTYTDQPLESGKYSYRLKQIDFDGSFSYSKTAEVQVNLLNKFFLEQNYPNPFNPNTKIKYSILSKSLVLLKIYDLLGNEVGTLINEEKPAGVYEVELDASSLASGIYFYHLTAGKFSAIKKMTVIK